MNNKNERNAVKLSLNLKMVMNKSKENRWGALLTLILWALIIAFPCDSDAMETKSEANAQQMVTIEMCPGESQGPICLGGGSPCVFDYESAVGSWAMDRFTRSGGNRLLIKGPTGFGVAGGRFDISVEMITNGFYFSDPKETSIWGFIPSQNVCSGDLESSGGKKISPAFTMYTKDGPTEQGPDSACALASSRKVNKISTSGGSITGLDAYDTLFLDLPFMVSDTTIIGPGSQLSIQITMTEMSSGLILSDTKTLGIASRCYADESSLVLDFPFFPGSRNPGWWGSFTIMNQGKSDAVLSIIYRDMEGNQASYTTDSIIPGGHFQSNAIPFGDLSKIAGTFTGESNYSVSVYSKGPRHFEGVAFLGNQDQQTGYSSYANVTGYQSYYAGYSWQTDLYFPYMPGDQGFGWQGGFEITNGCARTGKATLVFTDVLGNTATYTTPDIIGGGQWSTASISYGDLTQINGDFRFSENYSVKVKCDFCLAGGFAYIIDGGQASCYKAYSSRWKE